MMQLTMDGFRIYPFGQLHQGCGIRSPTQTPLLSNRRELDEIDFLKRFAMDPLYMWKLSPLYSHKWHTRDPFTSALFHRRIAFQKMLHLTFTPLATHSYYLPQRTYYQTNELAEMKFASLFTAATAASAVSAFGNSVRSGLSSLVLYRGQDTQSPLSGNPAQRYFQDKCSLPIGCDASNITVHTSPPAFTSPDGRYVDHTEVLSRNTTRLNEIVRLAEGEHGPYDWKDIPLTDIERAITDLKDIQADDKAVLESLRDLSRKGLFLPKLTEGTGCNYDLKTKVDTDLPDFRGLQDHVHVS